MPPPDCAACDRPTVWPANQGALEVWAAASGLLEDGWGGINLANARLAAEALGYDWDAALLAKLRVLVLVLLRKVGRLPEEEDGD